MTFLETAVFLGLVGLLVAEPVRRAREWRERRRPDAQHRARMAALDEATR